MLVDNVFDSCIAPDVSVQHLTGKLLHVLNIDHQPLVGCPASITGLSQYTKPVSTTLN